MIKSYFVDLIWNVCLERIVCFSEYFADFFSLLMLCILY